MTGSPVKLPATGPHCCIIGHPVAHSRSPLIHQHWLALHRLQGSYERVDVAPDALSSFVLRLRAGEFSGCNVTVPHKQAILPLLDGITPGAKAIGAVNTLFVEDGRLMGDNTDVTGFLAHLDASAPDWQRATTTALVLGAGGAARGIVYGLLARGVAQILLANRDPARGEALAADFGSAVKPVAWSARHGLVERADIIVNTTSLGMKGQPPLELELAGLRPGSFVDDIVYVPLKTQLLREAEVLGAVTIDGLGMLLHQAVSGFARWFGVTPSVTPELRALIVAHVEAGT